GFKRAHAQAQRLGELAFLHQAVDVRAVGWDSVEIEQWIAERLKERA
ncbi:transcriptional regulator, partial [Stutzerimonas stutzeri]|nr:transcriptional regulator [Stutzerimonas stutzeri]